MKQILNEELIAGAAWDYAEETKDTTNGMFYSGSQEAFKAGVSWCRKFYEDAITNLIAENQGLKSLNDKWNELIEINPNPEKWLKVYKHYQELLNVEDAAIFWKNQYEMCGVIKEKLAVEFADWINNDCKIYDKWARYIVTSKELFEEFLKQRNNNA